MLLSRYLSAFPYTVAMMLLGILLGLLHKGTDQGLGVLSDSIHAWDHIDPHLLMYAFIPALLFGGESAPVSLSLTASLGRLDESQLAPRKAMPPAVPSPRRTRCCDRHRTHWSRGQIRLPVRLELEDGILLRFNHSSHRPCCGMSPLSHINDSTVANDI